MLPHPAYTPRIQLYTSHTSAHVIFTVTVLISRQKLKPKVNYYKYSQSSDLEDPREDVALDVAFLILTLISSGFFL